MEAITQQQWNKCVWNNEVRARRWFASGFTVIFSRRKGDTRYWREWSSDVCSSDLLAGKVFSGEARIEKPGQALPADRPLSVRGQDHPWVSRGGVKLAHGLAHFGLSPAGRVCLDVGAPPRGLPPVPLPRRAERGYAGGVGPGPPRSALRPAPARGRRGR